VKTRKRECITSLVEFSSITIYVSCSAYSSYTLPSSVNVTNRQKIKQQSTVNTIIIIKSIQHVKKILIKKNGAAIGKKKLEEDTFLILSILIKVWHFFREIKTTSDFWEESVCWK